MSKIFNPYRTELWQPRTLDLHTAAILDLDNCVADNNHRMYLLPTKGLSADEAASAWHKFYVGMSQDGFNSHIYAMYQYLCGKYPTIRRIVITGRPETYRANTCKWLLDHNIEIDELYMRAEGDFCANAKLKLKYIEKLQADGIKCVFAFEDDVNTCRALQQAKIYVYQIIQPNKIIPFVDSVLPLAAD